VWKYSTRGCGEFPVGYWKNSSRGQENIYFIMQRLMKNWRKIILFKRKKDF
jgi:hypothetical protein